MPGRDFAFYSRYLVCTPVTELQGVMDVVYKGFAFPDDQRSGLFKAPKDLVPSHRLSRWNQTM